VLLGVLGGVAVAALYGWRNLWPRWRALQDPYVDAAPVAKPPARATRDPTAPFDLAATLPGSPLGLGWSSGALIAGDRGGGLLRVRRDDPQRWRVEAIPVIEPARGQGIGFWGFAVAPDFLVANVDAAWFGGRGAVFARISRSDYRLGYRRSAPEHLGAMVWDGEGYWAATRKDTPDADQEAWLYRLDRDLEVVARHEPPGIGCQGLAWDGELLWFVDVFADEIVMLAVDGGEPRVVHRHRVGFSYLSGIAYDGHHIWVTEYGDDRLLRLHPVLQGQWRGAALWGDGAGSPTRSDDYSASAELSRLRPAQPPGELLRLLRHPDPAVRRRARLDLFRAGLPADYERATPSNAEAAEREPMTVEDWSIELEGDALYATLALRFDPRLFAGPAPSGILRIEKLARYRVTIDGGTLAEPIVRTFEATPGANRRPRERLAEGLGAGVYTASLFLHAQYVDRDGTPQILNRSAGTLSVER
jgi:hypothetical protein